MVTYDSIKNDPAIREYIKSADESLLALGYTEHSFAHVGMVTSRVEYILSSLDFNKKDIELAKAVIAHDDKVDEYFDRIKGSLIKMIAEDPENGEYALDLLMIAKYFERIGDHATNIAEWVIFSVTGEHKNS